MEIGKTSTEMRIGMKLEIETKINVAELYEFTINHNYKSFHGIVSLLFSIASAVGAVVFWDRLSIMNRVLIILFALMFTVFEPVGCYIKVCKQVKNAFSQPIKYIFDKNGLKIVQGEASAQCQWHEIMKVTSTKNLVNVYTTPVRAFILPKKDIGQQFEDLKKLMQDNTQCLKFDMRNGD